MRVDQFYELFKKFSFEAIRRGEIFFGADLIAKRIQWEIDIENNSPDHFEKFDQDGPPLLKLSKEEVSYYSRKFMRDYPMYEGFFVEDRNWDTDNIWPIDEEFEEEDEEE